MAKAAKRKTPTPTPTRKTPTPARKVQPPKKNLFGVLEHISKATGKKIVSAIYYDSSCTKQYFAFEGIPYFIFRIIGVGDDEKTRKKSAAFSFLSISSEFLPNRQATTVLKKENRCKEALDVLVHVVKTCGDGLDRFFCLKTCGQFDTKTSMKESLDSLRRFIIAQMIIYYENFPYFPSVPESTPSLPTEHSASPEITIDAVIQKTPPTIQIDSDSDVVSVKDDGATSEGRNGICREVKEGPSSPNLCLHSSRINDASIVKDVVQQCHLNGTQGTPVRPYRYEVAGVGDQKEFLEKFETVRKKSYDQRRARQPVKQIFGQFDSDDDSDCEPPMKMIKMNDISLNIEKDASPERFTNFEKGDDVINSPALSGKLSLDIVLDKNAPVFEDCANMDDWAAKHGLQSNYEETLIGVHADIQMARSNEKMTNVAMIGNRLAIEKLKVDAWNHYLNNIQKQDHFAKKMEIRELLLNSFQKQFPRHNLQLYTVGSTVNGCGAFNSDIDMCLCVPNNPASANRFEDFSGEKKIASDVLKKLHYGVTNNPRHPVSQFVKSSMFIKTAKVPIIRLIMSNYYDEVDVDINVNNIAGVYNSHLIHYYSRIDVRFPALALLVKHWAIRADIGDAAAGTFSSYSLILLVIHYLQCGVRPAVLPNLQYLCPEKFNDRMLLNSLTLFEDIKDKIPSRPHNTQSMAELVIGFFNYYDNFQFKKYAVSIKEGRKFDRTRRKDIAHYMIYIEEPFGSGNTGRSLNKAHNMEKVKNAFRAAANTFKVKGFDLLDIGVQVD